MKDDQQIVVQLPRDKYGIVIARPHFFSNLFVSQQQEERFEENLSEFGPALAPYNAVFVGDRFLAGDDIVWFANNHQYTRRFDGLTHFDCLPVNRVLTRFMFLLSLKVAFLASRGSFLHDLSYVDVDMRTGIDVLEKNDRSCGQVSDVVVQETLISTGLSCILRCVRIVVCLRWRGVNVLNHTDKFIRRHRNLCTDHDLTKLSIINLSQLIDKIFLPPCDNIVVG